MLGFGWPCPLGTLLNWVDATEGGGAWLCAWLGARLWALVSYSALLIADVSFKFLCRCSFKFLCRCSFKFLCCVLVCLELPNILLNILLDLVWVCGFLEEDDCLWEVDLERLNSRLNKLLDWVCGFLEDDDCLWEVGLELLDIRLNILLDLVWVCGFLEVDLERLNSRLNILLDLVWVCGFIEDDDCLWEVGPLKLELLFSLFLKFTDFVAYFFPWCLNIGLGGFDGLPSIGFVVKLISIGE